MISFLLKLNCILYLNLKSLVSCENNWEKMSKAKNQGWQVQNCGPLPLTSMNAAEKVLKNTKWKIISCEILIHYDDDKHIFDIDYNIKNGWETKACHFVKLCSCSFKSLLKFPFTF